VGKHQPRLGFSACDCTPAASKHITSAAICKRIRLSEVEEQKRGVGCRDSEIATAYRPLSTMAGSHLGSRAISRTCVIADQRSSHLSASCALRAAWKHRKMMHNVSSETIMWQARDSFFLPFMSQNSHSSPQPESFIPVPVRCYVTRSKKMR